MSTPAYDEARHTEFNQRLRAAGLASWNKATYLAVSASPRDRHSAAAAYKQLESARPDHREGAKRFLENAAKRFFVADETGATNAPAAAQTAPATQQPINPPLPPPDADTGAVRQQAPRDRSSNGANHAQPAAAARDSRVTSTNAPPARSSEARAPEQRPPRPRDDDRPRAGSEAATSSPATEPKPKYEKSWHVYGGKHAVCFKPFVSREDDIALLIEVAAARGPRSYDWENKLSLMLDAKELPVLTALLHGMTDKCAFNNHGPNHDKNVEIEDQGTNLFLKAWAKGRSHQIPIQPEDAYQVATMCMTQLRKSSPKDTQTDILQRLKLVFVRLKHGQAQQRTH